MARIIAIVGVVAVVILGGYYFFAPIPPIKVVDRLCGFVNGEQKMECVAVLASDTFMKPGAIVEFRDTADGTSRVPLPVSDLFGPTCLLPGVNRDTLKASVSDPQAVSIPELTYQTNRALTAGADVEIPKLEGTTFKAGPEWSDTSKIDLAVEEAWATRLDEIAAVDAYRSCRINTVCTNYIKSENYRVVGTALVAKGLSYKVYNKNNELISLQAAAKSNQFTVNFGGKTDIQTTTDATIKAAAPRVVGVRLLPAKVFTGEQTCGETVIFLPPDGSASVSIDGGGGRGSIGALQSANKPIGQTALLSARGTEASECDDGFERKQSGAHAEARVDEDGPGGVKFSYKVSAEGGHYATAAQCLGNVVVGKTGHDTSASAAAELRATIFILVRSDSSTRLRVAYGDMPPGTRLQLVDWNRKPAQVVRKVMSSEGTLVDRRADMPASVSGSGDETFEVRGAGQYRLEATFQLNASVTGNVNGNKESAASVRVAVVN